MKGVSPGTALVFLLVGPATNITSLSVLIGLLGKRASVLYLLSIGIISVLCGLLLDAVYLSFGISAVAIAGQAAEIIPSALILAATLLLFVLSIKPLFRIVRGWFSSDSGCGCSTASCTTGHNHNYNSGQDKNVSDCGCGDSSKANEPVPLHFKDMRSDKTNQ